MLSMSGASKVRIEAGWFTMGSTDRHLRFAAKLCASGSPDARLCRPELFRHEVPARRVFLRAYAMDRTEVSIRAYRRCTAANQCPALRLSHSDARVARPEHPAAGVTWTEAQRYCEWAGGRLPTEAEWERAARGNSRRRFPWGFYFNTRVANHGSADGGPDPIDGYRYAAPVAAFPDGRSAHGLLNMAGNVWELTADRYAADHYVEADRVNPTGPALGSERVIRGGSWRSPAYQLRVTHRDKLAPNESRPDVGFRCAYSTAQ